MHGLIFAELQKYAETKHGKGTWQALLKKLRSISPFGSTQTLKWWPWLWRHLR